MQEKKLDSIYDKIDDLSYNEDFEKIDNILNSISVPETKIVELIAYLTVTIPVKSKLKNRSIFYKNVELKLQEIYGKKLVDELLKGLG